MTLNQKTLNKWQKSMVTPLSPEQKRIILERFGTEPEPYEWTEQDIWVQIRNYLACGDFVKESQEISNPSPLPLGIEF